MVDILQTLIKLVEKKGSKFKSLLVSYQMWNFGKSKYVNQFFLWKIISYIFDTTLLFNSYVKLVKVLYMW